MSIHFHNRKKLFMILYEAMNTQNINHYVSSFAFPAKNPIKLNTEVIIIQTATKIAVIFLRLKTGRSSIVFQ